ncbi:MAG: CBS domain-containing protein [Planctomycetes bacterium]|nr:CBS domain-containing protein [Planctomycetota bacterium]MCB9891548.1 CBS domain-containing protein [Planctomycetota bacterium]
MHVRDVLANKGRDVHSIAPTVRVDEALARLVKLHIGALMVLDAEERVLGIITERDVLRLAAKGPGTFRDHEVSEVMTRELVTACADDTLAHVLSLMTEHRVRHMPIMEAHRLVGLVSIGDLVKAQLDEVREENGQLREYLYGA